MFTAGIRIEIAIIAFCLAKWDMDIYTNAAARNISPFMRTQQEHKRTILVKMSSANNTGNNTRGRANPASVRS